MTTGGHTIFYCITARTVLIINIACNLLTCGLDVINNVVMLNDWEISVSSFFRTRFIWAADSNMVDFVNLMDNGFYLGDQIFG